MLFENNGNWNVEFAATNESVYREVNCCRGDGKPSPFFVGEGEAHPSTAARRIAFIRVW